MRTGLKRKWSYEARLGKVRKKLRRYSWRRRREWYWQIPWDCRSLDFSPVGSKIPRLPFRWHHAQTTIISTSFALSFTGSVTWNTQEQRHKHTAMNFIENTDVFVFSPVRLRWFMTQTDTAVYPKRYREDGQAPLKMKKESCIKWHHLFPILSIPCECGTGR